MLKVRHYRIAAVGGVLLALLLSTGGWVLTQAQAAGRGEALQILTYDNLVRFVIREQGASILRVEIFDPSGKRLYDSGPSLGNVLDWPLITNNGDRVAHGVYLYVVSAWDDQGELLKSKVGKLALVPGGVGLGQAPTTPRGRQERLPVEVEQDQIRAQAFDVNGNWTVSGSLGVGTDTPSRKLDVDAGSDRFVANIRSSDHAVFTVETTTTGNNPSYSMKSPTQEWRFEGIGELRWNVKDVTSNTVPFAIARGTPSWTLFLRNNGNVGIGTSSPQATLDVRGSASNLVRAVNATTGQSVFRVENDGDVYADGSYNCGLSSGCFNANQGADVAERIDAIEPLEPGDVVEIDPDHPGKFRKAREAMSRRVAGVISTAPAITLGNNFDPEADRWEDNRPLLALAGRVPVKAVAKFGAIEVGDLLVASPIPGYAMKCPEASQCVGAIIGKALEPLTEGAGKILIQVTLR